MGINGNHEDDDGPDTSRSERPRAVDAERAADAFIGRVVESAAGAWREAKAARDEVAQLRVDTTNGLRDVRLSVDRLTLRYAHVNDGQHALGRSVDALATQLSGDRQATVAAYDRLRAEVAPLVSTVARLEQRLNSQETKLEDVEEKADETGRHASAAVAEKARRFDELAADEMQKRTADRRRLVAALVLAIATAVLGWLTGRSGTHAPPVHDSHQEVSP